jgi:hypothetical protein
VGWPLMNADERGLKKQKFVDKNQRSSAFISGPFMFFFELPK